MVAVEALLPAVLLLLVGILAIVLVRPIKLSPIVGYLIAGLIIGPHAWGLIEESKTTHVLAELGVVFLLFDIGLHFSLPRIWEARRDILGLGPLQVLVCGLAFGGIAVAMGFATEQAVILGGMLALSSTAVVVRAIAERRQQNCPVGRTSTAVLILQDIVAIFLLVLATSLEGGGEPSAQPDLGVAVAAALAKAAVAFLAAILVGRYAVKPVFGMLARSRNEEVFTATALFLVLATAAATGGAGLSLTLGAFLGGMMIAETPYRHVIQTEARPFRDLLLAFFFISVGMSLDWRVLLENWFGVLAFLLALIASKTLLIAAAARVLGWSTPGAVQLGFLLAQGSEFAFVIVAMPSIRAALGEVAVGVILTGVAISMALTPALADLGNRVARMLRQRAEAPASATQGSTDSAIAPVVVFGMDEVGRTVVDALMENGVAFDAVEMDYDRFLAASADGYPVAFGDVGDIRLMATLHMGERSTVVVTVVRYELSKALTPIVSDRYPKLARFIAVDGEGDRERFASLGMRPVVNRSIPRGIDLAAAVLRAQNVSEVQIQEWMRRRQERALDATSADGDGLA